MRGSVFAILGFALCVGAAYGGENDNRNEAKAFFDAALGLIPKVGGAVNKGRAIGQGMNDMAIPGRKEFQNFDRNAPGFQAWLKRKEEERARRERERKQSEEARRTYSNQGGTQVTIVSERAQGSAQLRRIIEEAQSKQQQDKPPAGTISARTAQSTAKVAPERSTAASSPAKTPDAEGTKNDFLGELFKRRAANQE